MPYINSGKKMIITRISGGLGNQMFQYAAGYALAKKLDCELKVDTSFYPRQSLRTLDLNYFDLPLNIATHKECLKLGAPINFNNKLIKKLGLSSVLLPNYLEESQSFAYEECISSVAAPVYLDGYWQNLKYFEEYRAELSRVFTPKIEYGSVFKEYLAKIQGAQSVSLHIRRGDYVNDPHARSIHYVCDLDYYLKAIESVQKIVSSPTFFIFSDDIVWCKKKFGLLASKVFIEKTKNAIEDFQLMRNCQVNVISNSTFSWWASFINVYQKCDTAVFFPTNWQKNVALTQINLKFDSAPECK